METRERNSINHINPPQSNQDSSPRLNTTPLISSSNETTLNHHHHHHQANNFHGFKLYREKLEPQRPRKNPNPDPNPPPPPSTTVTPPVVRYRECLKNHAANMGAHVLDGCGEFMPAGQDNTPEALKCAACECHRSFHRRDVEGDQSRSRNINAPPPRTINLPPAPQQPWRYNYQYYRPPIMMSFGGANGAPAESSSEDFSMLMAQTTSSKKRFRTKFSQEQKEKMLDFAETIGWKIRKEDEEVVLRFCNEVGLKKQVFKVWMHNNKLAAAKRK